MSKQLLDALQPKESNPPSAPSKFKGGQPGKSPFSKGGFRGILKNEEPLKIPPTPPFSKGGKITCPPLNPSREGSFPRGCQPSVCFDALSRGLPKPCAEPVPRCFSREEYYRMGEAGIFAPDEHVELIQGEILYMAPQGSPHFTSICAAEEALRAAFGAGFQVRLQGPITLGPSSEPEPDIAVVPGSFRDYEEDHPTSALLVVEVSESTLVYDRTTKASLYASAHIVDYWIINLVEEIVEVYRSPKPDSTVPFGACYGQVTQHKRSDVVSPLSAPQASIRVEDLLPRRQVEL